MARSAIDFHRTKPDPTADTVRDTRAERAIVRIAEGQLGLVTLEQATAVGVDREAIRRRVRAGLLVRLFVGVFRLVGVEPTRRQESLAACLAVTNSAVCGLSAASIHDLPVTASKWTKPSVAIPSDQRVFAAGIDVRRTRNLPPTQPWFSGRITTVPATIVDLAGLVNPATLGRCLDHAIANRTATVASVLAVVSKRPPARFTGRATLLEALHARSDGKLLHRSAYERKAMQWLLNAGLPKPNSNLVVNGIEVDFAWPRFKIGLEISPFYTHGSEVTQQRDAERRRILQTARWRVIEATDTHLAGEAAFAPIVADLRSLLRSVDENAR